MSAFVSSLCPSWPGHNLSLRVTVEINYLERVSWSWLLSVFVMLVVRKLIVIEAVIISSVFVGPVVITMTLMALVLVVWATVDSIVDICNLHVIHCRVCLCCVGPE